MSTGGTPEAARQARGALEKQAEALRIALRDADRLSSEQRATLENQARSRDYRGVAKTAALIAQEAKVAQANAEALDKTMAELGKGKAHGIRGS